MLMPEDDLLIRLQAFTSHFSYFFFFQCLKWESLVEFFNEFVLMIWKIMT